MSDASIYETSTLGTKGERSKNYGDVILWVSITEAEAASEEGLEKGDFVALGKFRELASVECDNRSRQRGIVIELGDGRFIPEGVEYTLYEKDPEVLGEKPEERRGQTEESDPSREDQNLTLDTRSIVELLKFLDREDLSDEEQSTSRSRSFGHSGTRI